MKIRNVIGAFFGATIVAGAGFSCGGGGGGGGNGVDPPSCDPVTCEESVCGIYTDLCGNVTDCSCRYHIAPNIGALGRPLDTLTLPSGNTIIASGAMGTNIVLTEKKDGTWIAMPVGMGTPSESTSFVSLAQPESDVLFILSGVQSGEVKLRTRTGSTFSEEIIDTALTGAVAVLPDGNPVLVLNTATGLVRREKVAGTWTTKLLVDIAEQPRYLAARTADDGLYIAFSSGDGRLKVIKPDGSIDDVDGINDMTPWIAVDPDGAAHIFYAYGSEVRHAYFEESWKKDVVTQSSASITDVTAVFTLDGRLHVSSHGRSELVDISSLSQGHFFTQHVTNHCDEDGRAYLIGAEKTPLMAEFCDWGSAVVEPLERYPEGTLADCEEMAKSILDQACACTADQNGKQCCITYESPMGSGTSCGGSYNTSRFCGDAWLTAEARQSCAMSTSALTCVNAELVLTPECASVYAGP